MDETFADLMIDYISQKGYTPNDKILFKYGFNIFTRYFLLAIVVSIFIFIHGDAQYILLFDCVVILMRFHCGGYHLKSPINCFFVSVFVLTVMPKIILTLNIKFYCIIVLLFASVLHLSFSKSIQNSRKVIRQGLMKKIDKRKKVLLLFLSISSILFIIVDIKYTQMCVFALSFVSSVILLDKSAKNRR